MHKHYKTDRTEEELEQLIWRLHPEWDELHPKIQERLLATHDMYLLFNDDPHYPPDPILKAAHVHAIEIEEEARHAAKLGQFNKKTRQDTWKKMAG